MDIPLISLEITPDIALKIRGLAEAGVFAIHTGNATLNFHEGVLKSIKTELYSYPSLSPPVSLDIKKRQPILKKFSA
jgi:hypothetical protein